MKGAIRRPNLFREKKQGCNKKGEDTRGRGKLKDPGGENKFVGEKRREKKVSESFRGGRGGGGGLFCDKIAAMRETCRGRSGLQVSL